MRTIAILFILSLSACESYDGGLDAHLKAEQDFHDHQAYLEEIYTKYDSEYVDDCLYYEDLVCEFK